MTVNIEGTSFSSEIARRPGFTCMNIQGDHATGKTTFALTAPGPIAYMDFDFNGKIAVARAAQEKEIVEAKFPFKLPMPTLDFKRDPAREEAEKLAAKTVVSQFKNDYEKILAAGVRTVIWDTASELWEILRLSHFGRLEKIPSQLYVVPNADYRSMVRDARKAGVNLLLINKVKDVWESVTRGENTIRQPKINPWTKEVEKTQSGMTDLGFLVEMAVESRFVRPVVDMTKPERPQKKPGRFFTDILRCDDNANLVGTSWETATFEDLMTMAFPEHDWSK